MKNHTLLIIEDDPDTSQMLRSYFESQSYNIITAATGSDGLQKCRTQKPDLVLLDINLPDIDGFEIGKKLQQDVRTSRLPLIYVTERRARDDRITGLRLGAIDYVTKPFDVQELRLRVRNSLRRVGSQNNPITGLPGEQVTDNRLSMMLERTHWAVLGIRLSGLDKFNEIYGFVARDDVLRAVALTLTSAVDELGTVDDFIGHPLENQLLVLSVPQKISQLQQHIESRLNQAMVYFYPIHDREAGYVQLNDAQDEKHRVPFMQVSTVILSSQHDQFADVEAFKQRLNQLIGR